jgi:hypothetical protein
MGYNESIMIIFPDNNLPDQSQDWADVVEREIKKFDKKGGNSQNTSTTVTIQGEQGVKGDKGDAGPEGPEGPRGQTGLPGKDGLQGPQGPQGEPGVDGADGIQGEPGQDGADGTEGPAGPRGEAGLDGATGPKGDKGDTGQQGPKGLNGTPGVDGDSAYEIAKQNGFKGTEQQWLDSLIGSVGPMGGNGATGPAGPQGIQGYTGLSAYQVAQANGFTGTEQEWLDSLSATSSLPAGGTAGQVLSKVNSADYNVQWSDATSASSYTSVVKHTVKAGEALTKGQAVYVTSADGTNMIVSKASNASESTSSKTMGLLAQGLAHNNFGFVITEGLLAGLNTASAAAGDPVWLGTAGNLIFGLANKPSAPNHLVFIGIVTRSNANNGEIFVKVQNGFELKELHDVSLNGVQNNDVLTYEASTGLWKATKAALRYTHTQTAAISTWTIVHNMGYMPNVTVIDSGGNDVEGSIVYNSTDTLTISFSAEMSGVAYLS